MNTRTRTFTFAGWFTKDGDSARRNQVAGQASSLVRRWISDCGRWRVDFGAQTDCTIFGICHDSGDWRKLRSQWMGADLTVTDAFAYCRWRSSLGLNF